MKTLGLTLAQIGDLNAVYAIAGSTRQMLAHLDEQLESRLQDLDRRIEELSDLRGDIQAYRDHARERAASGRAAS